jgi:hypothetical protein
MKTGVKIAVGIAILTAGYYAYKKYYQNQTYWAKQVMMYGGTMGGTLEALASFDKDFLKAWADALKAKMATFSLNGKEYWSEGGGAVRYTTGTNTGLRIPKTDSKKKVVDAILNLPLNPILTPNLFI